MPAHYYENVPTLGNVAVSRHALDRIAAQGIGKAAFEEALFTGEMTPEGDAITWREKNGVRLVIINKPEPFRGAKLVKTVFKIKPQGRAT